MLGTVLGRYSYQCASAEKNEFGHDLSAWASNLYSDRRSVTGNVIKALPDDVAGIPLKSDDRGTFRADVDQQALLIHIGRGGDTPTQILALEIVQHIPAPTDLARLFG